MDRRDHRIPTPYRLAVVARVCAAVIVALALLVAGYSVPVERVYAVDADPAPAAHDNGPTGYFPDLFEAGGVALDPLEPVPTF